MHQIHCKRQNITLSILVFITSLLFCQVIGASSPTPISTPEAIYAALDRWQTAWRERDTDGYISSYSPTYSGTQYSHHAKWVMAREQRLKSQRWVKLTLSGIVIFVRDDGKYAANFTQQYRSDSFSDVSRKQLLFEKHPEGWLIVSESEIKD